MRIEVLFIIQENEWLGGKIPLYRRSREYHHARWYQSGFTFIEIIAVLILIGIMSAIALSKNSSSAADVIGDTEALKTHLRFAQIKAMTSNTSWGIKFDGNTYTLQENGAASVKILPGFGTSTATLSSGHSVTPTVNPITFDEWGNPGNATITVTINGDGMSRTIIVNKNTGFIP